MRAATQEALTRLGLHAGWVEHGLVDEAFVLDQATHAPADADGADEHLRVPVYAQFFAARADRVSDADLDRYLELVEHEPDATLQSWAVGFLVEHGGLTVDQLRRLAAHPLVVREEKHLFFLRRTLDARR